MKIHDLSRRGRMAPDCRSALGVLAMAACLLGGCQPADEKTPEKSPTQDAGKTDAGKTPDVPKEDTTTRITPVDRPAYDKIVADHHGKVVLVDMWALW